MSAAEVIAGRLSSYSNRAAIADAVIEALSAARYVVVELPRPDEDGDWFVLDVGSTCVNEGGISMVVPFSTQLTATIAEARQFAAALLAAADAAEANA